jgi:hypothetical protein
MPDTTRTPDSNEPIAFDERTRRVLELRRRVRAGTYRPDPELVARAILSEWFALGLELEREAAPPTLETAAKRQNLAGRFLVEKSPAVSDDTGRGLTA